MRKVLLTILLMGTSVAVNAVTVTLEAHNQRSSSGTLNTLKWSGCTTYSTTTGCINPGNMGLASRGITASTAIWDWDAAKGVLSMTGSFNTAWTLGSSGAAAASVILAERVTNLVIDTTIHTTSGGSYICSEGGFFATVGASGCKNTSLGADFANNSSIVYLSLIHI